MKRLSLITIVTFILIMSISITSFADSFSYVPSIGIDPRYDSRYAFAFDVSDVAGIEDYPYVGHYIIRRFIYDSGEYHELYCYGTIYSKCERTALVMTEDENCLDTDNFKYQLYFLSPFSIYNLSAVRDNYYVCSAMEQLNGSFWAGKSSYTNYAKFGFGWSNTGNGLGHGFSNGTSFEIVECDYPVFSNDDDAYYYYNTGIVRDSLYNPTLEFDNDDLWIKNVEVTAMKSPYLNDYYLILSYELSPTVKALLGVEDIYFDIYDKCVVNNYCLDNFFYDVQTDYLTNSKVFLTSENLNRCYIRFSDLPNVAFVYSFLGGNLFLPQKKDCPLDLELGAGVDFYKKATLSAKLKTPLGSEVVQSSYVNLDFTLRWGSKVSNKNTIRYDFYTNTATLDIYSPVQDTYTPSQNVEYSKQGDTSTFTSFYSKEGDTYYYNYDNSNRVEIDKNTYDNASFDINASGGSSSSDSSSSATGGSASATATVGDININVGSGVEYVNVSPQDYSNFIDCIKNVLENFDTKSDFFALLQSYYALFPLPVWLILGAGLSGVVVVSYIKILRG